MLVEILTSFLLQTVFTVGIIFLFGYFIALCNKRFYTNLGSYGKAACYLTGAVGTPVHECAHALFCLIFGHKITEIKLFQINSADGTLGYVNHSYNPKNLYHRAGNFFIGIAPVAVISLLLYGLAYLLLPEYIAELSASLNTADFSENFGQVLLDILASVPIFFMYAATWRWWLFIIIGACFSLHMTLSAADIKSSLGGLLFWIGTVLFVDIILGIIGQNVLIGFTQVVLRFASYLFCILVNALVLSVIAVGLSYLFTLIKRKRR